MASPIHFLPLRIHESPSRRAVVVSPARGASVGPNAPRAPRGSTGLYHLAWEVPSIEDLADASKILAGVGALGGASDHGV